MEAEPPFCSVDNYLLANKRRGGGIIRLKKNKNAKKKNIFYRNLNFTYCF